MENGEISFEMVADAIRVATSEGGRFFRGMERSSQGLSGLLSTVADNIDIAMGKIGKDLIEAFELKDAARGLIAFTDRVREWVQRIMPQVKAFVQAVRTNVNQAIDFFMPYWKMVISFYQSIIEVVVQVGKNVFDAISEVWKQVSGSTKGIWKDIRDFIIEVLIMAEFAVRNFDKGFELAMLSVAYSAVKTFNQIVHILTVVLPAAGKYLLDNWKTVLSSLLFAWLGTVRAMNNAIIEMFRNLPSLIKGEKTIGQIIGPIFRQWETDMNQMLKELPKFKVPERVVGGLEKDLLGQLIDKGKQLFDDFLKFREKKMGELFGAEVPPEVPQAAEEAGKAVGKAFDQGMAKESGKAIDKVDAVLRRSVEAASRIQQQRDVLRSQRKGDVGGQTTRAEDPNKQLVDIQKRAFGALVDIARNVKNLSPFGAANL
jgi:hypothetical protein